jgi:hypothetical protein
LRRFICRVTGRLDLAGKAHRHVLVVWTKAGAILPSLVVSTWIQASAPDPLTARPQAALDGRLAIVRRWIEH